MNLQLHRALQSFGHSQFRKRLLVNAATFWICLLDYMKPHVLELQRGWHHLYALQVRLHMRMVR